MSELTFLVPGVAVPKGSRSTYRGRSVESSKRWPDWRKTVADYAVEARAKQHLKRFEGPVAVTISVFLPKPQRPKHLRHITRPDLDKLVRGVCDALTGVLWIDDSQVTVLMASKAYADADGPLVVVRVAEVE
jgi:Holliday junction resolvase RusA-like endonuclease